MAAENQIPLFPKAEWLFIHSGNIVNWNRLKKKPSQSPTTELVDCITAAITDWKETADINEIQYAPSIHCVNSKQQDPIKEEERNSLKLTLKIFLSACEPEIVCDALDTVMSELGTDHVESVLLSFPPEVLADDYQLSLLQPAWTALEKYLDEERVFVVGASDLSTEQLQEIYEWAQHKPTTNQVNLSYCCTIPPDMQQFAKQHDIQLLTHTDPRDLLPIDSFCQVLETTCSPRDAENWRPYWTCRYSTLVKGRGVIRSKGYLTKWSRDLKRRK